MKATRSRRAGSTAQVIGVHPHRRDRRRRAVPRRRSWTRARPGTGPVIAQFTHELHELAEGLRQAGVVTADMESTGVYWIPVFEVLETSGFKVVLLIARDVKNDPGRKTDVNDAQWPQRLHAYGLLPASCRPRHDIAMLRAYPRQLNRLFEDAAAHIQHTQKALMQMNLQLRHVVQNMTGGTGMKFIHSIIAGERNLERLARHCDVRCQASAETIRDALVGNYQDEHVFELTHAVAPYDFYHTPARQCDERIDLVLRQLQANATPVSTPLSASRRRSRQSNDFSFEMRAELNNVLGMDLRQIHGPASYLALKLAAECGTDISRRPTVNHFTS